MTITESTKEKLRSGLLATLLGGLGAVLTSIAKETSKPFADYVIPAIGSRNLLWLSLLLLLTTLVSLTWLLFLIFADKAKRLRGKYDFFEKAGYWVNKKTKMKVCGNCILVGIESPLHSGTMNNQNRWFCGVKTCQTSYLHDEQIGKSR